VVVDGATAFNVTKPGPGTVTVPALAVAVRTVVVPSTQVIVSPVCEQLVACALALPGRKQIAAAVETVLIKARRAIDFIDIPLS
jgi:hypothetical protein